MHAPGRRPQVLTAPRGTPGPSTLGLGLSVRFPEEPWSCRCLLKPGARPAVTEIWIPTALSLPAGRPREGLQPPGVRCGWLCPSEGGRRGQPMDCVQGLSWAPCTLAIQGTLLPGPFLHSQACLLPLTGPELPVTPCLSPLLPEMPGAQACGTRVPAFHYTRHVPPGGTGPWGLPSDGSCSGRDKGAVICKSQAASRRGLTRLPQGRWTGHPHAGGRRPASPLARLGFSPQPDPGKDRMWYRFLVLMLQGDP